MRVVSSLKHAFTLHYMIAASVPIILFAWVSFHYANSYLLQEVFKKNAFLAHEIGSQVSDFLAHRSGALRQVAILVLDDRLIKADDIDAYLSKQVDTLNDFESIYILDHAGKIAHLGLASDQEVWRNDYQGLDLSGHELFQRFERNEALGWSDTYTSLVTGELSISFGVAVGDHLVVGNLNLRQMGEIVSRFSLYDQPLSPNNGDAPLVFAIIDRRGVPIAHTDVDAVLRQISMRVHPVVLNALAGQEETAIFLHNDEKLVETGLPIQGTGWVVWISRNYEQVVEPLAATRDVFFLILSGSILAAILVGLLTARNILRPLGDLVNGVRALATGGGNTLPGRKSYTEIDELTHGFQRMSRSVLERETSLRNSEKRFRSLVNSVEGIVFEADFPGMEFTFVSERSNNILGYSAQEWMENPGFWQRCIHPDDRQWAYNYSMNQAEKGRNHQLEYRMLHHDGQVVWVRQMVNVVVDEGENTRLLGVLFDVTGSMEAAISLQESEQRFRSLVEQAADAIFIHDAQGYMVDVNEQACRSLGYNREELKRKRVPDIQILQAPMDFNTLQSSVMRGGSLTFEAEHRRKNNTHFPVEVRLGSFQYQDSPLFLALARDVTDRKRAVAALRESEERYRTVVSAMAEGVILLDGDGNIIAVNPAAENLLHRSASDLVGQKIEDVGSPRMYEDGSPIPPDQLPAVQALKTGLPVNALTGFPRENDTVDWIEVKAQPVTTFGAGRGGGVVVTMNDVTAKKTAEAALRESEERVRLLLDSTAEGIFGIDCENACTFCNPAGLKLLGFADEADLLGRNTHELFHAPRIDGNPSAQEGCRICNVLVSGEATHSDTESFSRVDGSVFPVEYFAQPVIKETNLVGVVVAFHDVTERKLLQQQSIRTAQLASLGELAAGVAHEINNPISGVINYAQILLSRNLKDGGETDLVERIIREGERVATIVKDLLFFARESGPEKSLSNIREVLEDSLSLSAAQIRKEGILLSVDYAEPLPMIKTRAQQIQQLFLNILSNARHALNQKYPTHHDNKRIDVTLAPVEHDNIPYIRIVFRDHGVGISPAMLKRVMHPFVTTKPSGIGTGLGLSISFEIVKKHGGNLWLESVEGESTDVYIELPIS